MPGKSEAVVDQVGIKEVGCSRHSNVIFAALQQSYYEARFQMSARRATLVRPS
jgi:hypothetical protein